MTAQENKEALKQLRQERQALVEQAKAMIKTQNKEIKLIKEHLTEDGKTVPEVSRKTGIPPSKVLVYISGLRKYGQVQEGAKDGDYFKYLLV